MEVQGLVLVNTGPGKGKTSAAMGVALRAWGQGLRVGIIQFIKSKDREYGELKALKQLGDRIEVFTLGAGFVRYGQENSKHATHREIAQEAFKLAEQKVLSAEYDLIVLDEINYALGMELIEASQVENLIKNKPKSLHLILTGRNAPTEIIALADSVTYMEEVKHHYKNGIGAQVGIEY